MRRFAIQFIIFIFCSNGFADETKKVMVIPIDKISDKKSYSTKELKTIFNNYLESYDGKSFWKYPVGSERELTGIVFPASFENSSSGNLALSCYRCGMGRSDLVNEADCKDLGYKWNLQSLTELKKTCN